MIGVVWAALAEALMRSRLVIVDEELLEHRFQVPRAEDQQVVQQLAAEGYLTLPSRTRS